MNTAAASGAAAVPPLRLLADENFPGPSVRALRAAGRDVLWIAERSPGIPDPAVIALARGDARVALTFDRDLAERVVRHHDSLPARARAPQVRSAVPLHAADVVLALLDRFDLTVVGRLTVVTSDRIRQRPFPIVGG